jgi:NadR type nicotinamide-nucleotide adenylyltransferase
LGSGCTKLGQLSHPRVGNRMQVARPTYNEIRKIALVGPECTGKTTLAQALAQHYATQFVPEYARGYIEALTRPYEFRDLLTIAQGQVRTEEERARSANKVLICDTNLVVIKVWSEFKYNTCDPWILEALDKRKYHLYLLLQPDVPWQADPQREHPTSREELYAIYKQELAAQPVAYVDVHGTEAARKALAIQAIDGLFVTA